MGPRETLKAIKLTATLLVLVVIIIALTVSLAKSTVIPILPEQVTVLDGDTIIVATTENEYRIRLEHIDAPEKHQDFGQDAKLYLENEINSQKVYLSVDLNGATTYDRFIGTLYTEDGISINKKMVAAGYAWWYRKYSDDPSYEVWETAARKQHLGLWTSDYPIAPWMYRMGIKRENHKHYYKYVEPK